MTTTAQQTALEKASIRVAYFIELHFVSGIIRLCNSGQSYVWGSHDWLGLGLLGKISPMEESAGVNSTAMTFTLNVTQYAILALAVGSVEDYRGQVAKLYFCPLDDQFRFIDTPELCWSGLMDTMVVSVDGEAGQIALKCETSVYGLKRRSPQRLNPAQHKQRHPGDTGLDYVTDLIARPQLWLSKKFQAA